MTRKELANAYGISTEALRYKLIRENVNIPSGLIYPKDLILIFEKLGTPSINEERLSSDDSYLEES